MTAAAEPVLAQTAPEAKIDALIEESSTPKSALSTARRQEREGDLSAAAATLERMLLADQNAHAIRLRYVSVLCRLDDRQGAELELAKLAGVPERQYQLVIFWHLQGC